MARASDMAERIYQIEWGQIDVIDAQLQEVREVLEEMRGYFGTNNCWCDSEGDAPHYQHCHRARALLSKLEIK